MKDRGNQHTASRSDVPELLEEAQAALTAAGGTDSLDRGLLLYELAAHYGYESLEAGLRTAEQAAEVLMYAGRGLEAANASRLAGRMHINAGRYGPAEAHLLRAVAQIQVSGEGGKAWLVNVHGEVAEVLLRQGRIVEAERRLRAAVETSRHAHGGSHRWTLEAQMRLASQLAATGAKEEASLLRAEVETALEELRPEYDAQFRARMAGYQCTAMIDLGRPDLSLPFQQADVNDRRAFFPGSYVLAEREAELAEVALAYGRYEEAAALLESGHACWRRYSGGHATPARGAMFAVVGARLCRARGDAAGAAAAIEGVVLPDSALLGRYHSTTLQLVAERSRAETACGRAEAGRALADAEWKAVRRVLGSACLPNAEAHLVRARAEARQALGDRAGAESDWHAAVRLRRRHDDAASLWLADDLVGWASCLAESHRSPEALVFADEAARIFDVHPQPGAHLMQPLERLRQRTVNPR